jgi:hypothetical protein
MNLDIKDYRGTKEEFDSLSLLEKRQYIIQTEQEDTMWYQRTVAKIQYISFLIGIVIGVLYLIHLI